MWVQYWSLISHWVTPGNTSQFPFLDSTASATWKKTQVSKVIGDTDDKTLWLLWKNFYLHLRNNNLPIKTAAEVSNSLYMANKKQREGTLSYPVYLMMKRSRTLWSLTTPSTTSPENGAYSYKANWRRKIWDTHKWIKMHVEFKYANDNDSFCTHCRWKNRVHDHSWNSRWDLIQCNISSHLQIRLTPAVHFTEPASSFSFLFPSSNPSY